MPITYEPIFKTGDEAINYQTGTSYTLTEQDAGGHVDFYNSSGVTVTIPDINWPLNCEITLTQMGTGQVTVGAGAGVTLVSYNDLTSLAGQYSAAVLRLINKADKLWLLVGNLA